MGISRRSTLVYGLLLAVWVLVVGWQIEEHVRVRETAKDDLRNRSRAIANTLSATIRALRFRGTILQERLEPVLNELIYGRTNKVPSSTELISVALLNAAGEPVAAAGQTLDLEQKDVLQQGEHWGAGRVTFVNPVHGASLRPEGSTNPTVILPPFQELTNRDSSAGISRGENQAPEANPSNNASDASTNRPSSGRTSRDDGDRRRPRWARFMDQAEYESLIERRELHGLVLAMSTGNFRSLTVRDIWQRCIIAFFAGMSAIVAGLAWRNLAKSSDLQIRLIRASEMNSHLKEMNLAAAGLAHETRNPLNIIRGMAQMISKQTDASGETRERSRAIVDETDKVTAQLNEFINYSRPREIRRTAIPLTAAVNEVVRALDYDLEEKKVRLEVKGTSLSIEADEQLLRQALFNLLFNAIQAVDFGGEIQVVTGENADTEGRLEVRDNGPGVPPERRTEIFKPYFTTHQKGTGLGLAVVQQIVLAHGWEIECLGNEPKGAVFRLTHLKLAE